MPLRSIFLLLLTCLLASGVSRLQAANPPDKIPDTIEQRVSGCTPCHGKQGEGIRKNEYYPRLAGKPTGYLYNQLQNFRELRRENQIMTYLVAYMSDAYLHDIAEYFSKLRPPFPPRAPRVSKEVLARGEALALNGDPSRNMPGCAACHGKTLTGMEPAIPGLVGLYPDYIAAQLSAWKGGHRHGKAPDCMQKIATRLAPDDISAVAAWLAVQPASPDTPPAPANSLKLPMECGGAQQQ